MSRPEHRVTRLFQQASPYQPVYVGELERVRFLRFGDHYAGWQGAMRLDRPDLLYFPYQRAFSLYTAWNADIRRFLALGVGTGTAIRHVHHRHPQAEIVGVEWDPLVLEVAQRFFMVPTDRRVRLIEEDVRTYVMALRDRFDLIFLDVYFQEQTPKALYTSYYLQALAALLEMGGVLAINAIVATKGPYSFPYVQLCATLEELIGPTYSITLGVIPHFTHNVMIFAHKMDAATSTLAQVRRRGWREISAHRAHYTWTSSVLPMLIKKSPKKV